MALSALLHRDLFARAERPSRHALSSDSSMTGLGHLLRMSGLDAAPQLWNVIKGEMSLVGPHPVAPEELPSLADSKNYYLKVRPGITGLWQMGDDRDLDDVTRSKLVTWYVRNWTLWYDIFILFRGAVGLPRHSGSHRGDVP